MTVIEVNGVQVPRAGMIEVAHLLVLQGQIETASLVLRGLVEGPRITLNGVNREAVLLVLNHTPTGHGQLRAALANEPVMPTGDEPDTGLGSVRAPVPSVAPIGA